MAEELSRLRTQNLQQTAEIAERDKTIAFQDSQLSSQFRYDYYNNLVSTPNGQQEQPPPRRPAPPPYLPRLFTKATALSHLNLRVVTKVHAPGSLSGP